MEYEPLLMQPYKQGNGLRKTYYREDCIGGSMNNKTLWLALITVSFLIHWCIYQIEIRIVDNRLMEVEKNIQTIHNEIYPVR